MMKQNGILCTDINFPAGKNTVTFSFFLIFFFNVYLFLGQRESMNGGGAEREGDTESETGSRL